MAKIPYNDPVVHLDFDNKPMDDLLARRLKSWSYEDEEKVDKLTLKFDNTDLEITDEPRFDHGVVIRFRHGYNKDLSGYKWFKVQKISGFKEITVECMEIITIFNTEQKNRAWLNSSLEDVIKEIAKDNKLEYETEERVGRNGEKLKFDYFQPHVEDFIFLWNLGQYIGYEVWVETGKLYFLPRQYWQTPYMSFTYNGLDGQIIEFTPETNSFGRRGKFEAGFVDLESKQSVFMLEDGKTVQRATFLDKKFWDYEKINGRYKELEQARLVQVPLNTRQEGEDILQGQWQEEMEDQITADLKLVGEPHIRARRVIEITNVGRYSGKYYVKSVEHNQDSGYVSTAKLTRNSTFDTGAKYSQENIDTLINNNRMSVAEFLNELKKKDAPSLRYYQGLIK